MGRRQTQTLPRPRRDITGRAEYNSGADRKMSEPKTEIGQSWAAWVPARQQWLVAAITQQKAGRITLKFDPRYGLCRGDDEREVEEQDLLGMSNLFRHIAAR